MHSLTDSLTHSLTHSINQSINHSITHSLTHSLNQSIYTNLDPHHDVNLDPPTHPQDWGARARLNGTQAPDHTSVGEDAAQRQLCAEHRYKLVWVTVRVTGRVRVRVTGRVRVTVRVRVRVRVEVKVRPWFEDLRLGLGLGLRL